MRKQPSNPKQTPSLWRNALMTGVSAYAFYTIQPHNDEMQALRYLCGAMAAAGGWHVLCDAPDVLYNRLLRRAARKASGNHGDAQWMSRRRARKLKLHTPEGFFLGRCAETGEPRWVPLKSHALILGSTGSGKTASLVNTNLMHDRNSAFVLDAKRTIYDVTADTRDKKFGHEICVLDAQADTADNPNHRLVRYNPYDIVIDAYRKGHQYRVIELAEMIAQILCPVPKDAGQNTFFYEGSQLLLQFIIVTLCLRTDTRHSNLSESLILAQDDEQLVAELHNTVCSDALNGDLAGMAKNLLRVQEEENSTHWQSFCSGVVQKLSPYSKSSNLGRVTSETTFSPREMKQRKITLYFHIDIQSKDIYDKFANLFTACAKYEWIDFEQHDNAHNKAVPLSLYLDEIANVPLKPLIESAMEIREFGLSMRMFIQSISGFMANYSKETFEMLLDQCELQYYMGILSENMASLLSRTLGNQTVVTTQYALGHHHYDHVNMGTGEMAQPLQAPYQILQSDEAVVLMRGEKPQRILPTSYSKITPYRVWQGINRFFGKKFKERVCLKLRYPSRFSWCGGFGLFKPKPFVAWYKRIRPKRDYSGLPYLLVRLYRFALPFAVIGTLWWGVQTYGAPYIFWDHNRMTCDYVTIGDIKRILNVGDCTLFKFLK